jgi:hypothetical protein
MHHFPFQNTFRSPHGVRSAFSDAKASNQNAWGVLIRLDFVFRDQIFARGMRAKICKIFCIISLLYSLSINLFLPANLWRFSLQNFISLHNPAQN